jgi:predicted RND superfamily exporter protein
MVLIAFMMVITGFQARHFKLDASADSLVLEHDEALRYYRVINQRYGTEDFLIITYTPIGELWSADSLQTLQEFKEDLLQLERIKSVVSILDAPLLNSPRISLTELADQYRTLETPGVDIHLAQQEFIHSPIYRKLLVSPDGKTTALLAYFKRDETYFSLLKKRNDLRDKKRNSAV